MNNLILSFMQLASSAEPKMDVWDKFAGKVEGLVYNGIRLIDKTLVTGEVTASPLMEQLTEMLIQLTATLILFVVVKFFVWDKVTKILDKRKQVVRDALQERDEALEQSKKLHEESEAELLNAHTESKQIIERAKTRGYEQAEQIVKEAEETAKLKIENAETEIDMKVKESQKEIRNQIVDVAYEMASTIVEKEIEKGTYDLNVDDYLNKVDADEKR